MAQIINLKGILLLASGCVHLCLLLLLSHLPAPVFFFFMGQGTDGPHSFFAVLKALLISTVSLLSLPQLPLNRSICSFQGFIRALLVSMAILHFTSLLWHRHWSWTLGGIFMCRLFKYVFISM
jgi:hypothetical protein